MNEALRRKDVHAVCVETARYFLCQEGVRKFLEDARVFFQKELLSSKNTYLLEFLECKRFDILEKRERLQRLTAIELAVFLCTCDRPESAVEGKRVSMVKNAEDVLVRELQRFAEEQDFDPPTIERCVRTLSKFGKAESEEMVEKLWKVSHRLSTAPPHLRRLRAHWDSLEDKKRAKFAPEVLVECFKTIYDGGSFFRDSRQYRPIIVQCMLKAEYIFESIGVVECGERAYITCLYHLPKIGAGSERHKYVEEGDIEDRSRFVTLLDRGVPYFSSPLR